MIIPRPWLLLPLLAILTACVTVHIYFPAAAAEQAADKIIRDIYGDTPKQGPQPELQPQSRAPVPLLERMVAIFIPAAQAQQADINISTPGINRLKSAMEARHRQLLPFYTSGAVGLTNQGLLAVRDPAAVPLQDRGRVNQLVAEENRDRNALYREIAQANGQPGWEPEIRETFARRWVANAPGGWWYQDRSGAWVTK